MNIIGQDGPLGTATEVGPDEVLLTLSDGTEVLLPKALLVETPDGSYRVSISGLELKSRGPQRPLVIPVMREELEVSRRRVPTGRVRITKAVSEREEVVEQPLMREEVDVERVPLGTFIESPPPIRYEGDTLVVPLVGEVLVVEKRLMLREELRIRRRQTEVREPQKIVLRTESADIERLET